MEAPADLLAGEPDPRRGLCLAARRLLGADLVALWERRGPGHAEPTATSGHGLVAGSLLLPLDGGSSAVATAMATARPVVLADATSTDQVSRELVERFGLRALVAQPLLRLGTAIGVLVAAWRTPGRVLDEDELQQLALLGAAGALAVQALQRSARLEHLALTDPLTGLPNRRELISHLERELARARRHGGTVGVAVLDLDALKAVNDDQGHEAGDDLLRRAATDWRARLRAGDLLARTGGDEFVLVLPDCGVPEACQATVERVRSASAPASAGVAVWDGAESAERLIARADQALYAAKRAGGARTLPHAAAAGPA